MPISCVLVSSLPKEHLEILYKKFQLSVEKKEAKKAAKMKRKASTHDNVGKKTKHSEDMATEINHGQQTATANSKKSMNESKALLVQKENAFAATIAPTQQAAALTVSALQQHILQTQLTNQSNHASQLALNQILISKARACAANVHGEVQKALKESADTNIAVEALLEISKTYSKQKHEG